MLLVQKVKCLIFHFFMAGADLISGNKIEIVSNPYKYGSSGLENFERLIHFNDFNH